MMNSSVMLQDLEYQNSFLLAVSRTFALTIPQLPKKLQEVVGCAYLLCRIADTIEDDSELKISDKLEAANYLLLSLDNEMHPHSFSENLFNRLSDKVSNDEKNLVKNYEVVHRIFSSFSAERQLTIKRCVRIMINGMLEFQQKNLAIGLDDLQSLNLYCYYVAGVVGEMLTELFCLYSPKMQNKRELLLKYATSFGQGLQMINILKDIWEDAERGVCWLPRDVFAKHGYYLNELSTKKTNKEWANALLELVAVAEGHLKNGLEFVTLLPRSEQGMRKFCLWALSMALINIKTIKNNPFFTAGSQVKISRTQVKLAIMLSNCAAPFNVLVKQLHRLSK